MFNDALEALDELNEISGADLSRFDGALNSLGTVGDLPQHVSLALDSLPCGSADEPRFEDVVGNILLLYFTVLSKVSFKKRRCIKQEKSFLHSNFYQKRE